MAKPKAGSSSSNKLSFNKKKFSGKHDKTEQNYRGQGR
jgi:hypothetical protein